MRCNWDRESGIWNFGIFHGTTPRNADIWTFDINLKKWQLWAGTGPHAYITFFSGEHEKWSVELDKEGCECFSCSMHRPLTPEMSAHLFEKLANRTWDEPFFTHKATSRHAPEHVCETSRCWSECHPPGCDLADCCGDPQAHGVEK